MAASAEGTGLLADPPTLSAISPEPRDAEEEATDNQASKNVTNESGADDVESLPAQGTGRDDRRQPHGAKAIVVGIDAADETKNAVGAETEEALIHSAPDFQPQSASPDPIGAELGQPRVDSPGEQAGSPATGGIVSSEPHGDADPSEGLTEAGEPGSPDGKSGQQIVTRDSGDGRLVEEAYCGKTSWRVGIVFPCIAFCPVDRRNVWIQNHITEV